MVTERMNKKTVTVFGLGFVGLTTALGFAARYSVLMWIRSGKGS